MKQSKRISTRGKLPDGAPNPVDVYVGSRIRLRRQLLGWPQEKLAELLGVTFQQIQKYERGTNRLGASRLWDAANILEVPVGFFFDDMDKETAVSSPRCLAGPEEPLSDNSLFGTTDDPMVRKETLELVRAYYQIPDPGTARCVFDLVVKLSRKIPGRQSQT